jgi:hemolysin activation/secretion protein
MRGGVSAFAALALTSTSLADASPLIVDQQRIDQTQATQPNGLRGLTDERGVAPLLSEPSPRPAASSSSAPGVSLRAVHISGSSLSAEILDAVWRRRVGLGLDDATITAISGALIAAYQRSDIALYSVVTPAQDLSSGVLDVQVSEGHIANIVIQTDDAGAPDIALARRYAERLTHESPLRRLTLERMMSFIRDIPGERVEATLQPSTDAGGTQLLLTLRRRRTDVGVSVSNRGTPLLGRTQGSFDAALNGMIRGGDRTDIALTLPLDQNSFRYAAISYTTPVGHDGASVSVNASTLHTEPRGLGVQGNATAGGASVSYPLLRGFTRNVTASVGVDALNTENATVGQVVDTSRTRALRVGASYADSSANSARNVSLFASFGIDGLGARVDPLFADADFFKLGASASWTHLFAQRLALRVSAQAQVGGSMLPASEQFALGGDAYGRAFASAVVQGDQGLAASIETAFLPPDGWLPSLFQGSEAYVFFDTGTVHVNDRPLLSGADYSLSSGGFGARIALGHQLTLGAEFARALDMPDGIDGDDWRLVYTLVGRR